MGIVVDARFRCSSIALTLVVGLALGVLGSQLVDGNDAGANGERWEFHDESPRIVDVPMGAAIDRLVDAGFRVMAVGHGKVKLQELGTRGHVLRIVGWSGTRLRYCTARLPNCVFVDPGYRPGR